MHGKGNVDTHPHLAQQYFGVFTSSIYYERIQAQRDGNIREHLPPEKVVPWCDGQGNGKDSVWLSAASEILPR